MKPSDVQRAAEAGDDLVADPEGAAGLFVDDEVGVALAEPRVGVGEPVPLVGHRTNGLRQQLDAVDLHAELAVAGGHDRALDAHPVAEVEIAERGEPVVADHRLGDEQLDLAAAVAQRGEDQLALLAAQHHPAGDGDSLVGLGAGLERSEASRSSVERVRAIEAVRVRIGTGVAQRPDLVEPLGLLGRQTTAAGVSARRRVLRDSQGPRRYRFDGADREPFRLAAQRCAGRLVADMRLDNDPETVRAQPWATNRN